jgi:DNA polymerase III sliding clamp (beta) subunit (PCNA family)
LVFYEGYGLGVRVLHRKLLYRRYDMMEFRCDVKVLKSIVGKIENLLDKRAPLEALKSVAVETTTDGVYIKATDLESFVIFKVSTDFSGVGSKFLVDVKQLIQVLKSLKGQTEVKFENNMLSLSDEKQTFHIKVSNNSYYPDFPVIPSSTFHYINAKTLFKAIEKVEYATFKDFKDKYYERNSLKYILINRSDFVATDGYRLALYSSKEINLPIEVKIHGNVVKILKNIIKDVKDVVMIANDEKYIYFKADNWEFITPNSNTTYPNYQYLINSFSGVEFNEFVIDKTMFINSLKYLQPSRNKDFALKLTLSDKVLIETKDKKVELAINYKGNSIILGINGKFLIESLERFDNDLVKIKVSDDIERPIFLESIDKDKDHYICLVMPMKS